MTVLACVLSCHLINENDDDDDALCWLKQLISPKLNSLLYFAVHILVFLRLSVLDLGPMYATDRRQTDRRQTIASLNASANDVIGTRGKVRTTTGVAG